MDNLKPRAVQAFNDIGILSKEISGLTQQKNEYNRAIVEVNTILNEFKSNKNQTMQMIVGGNLIKRLSNKDCIKQIENRKKQTEVALASVEQQLSHRNDALQENYVRIYHAIVSVLPDEMLE